MYFVSVLVPVAIYLAILGTGPLSTGVRHQRMLYDIEITITFPYFRVRVRSGVKVEVAVLGSP